MEQQITEQVSNAVRHKNFSSALFYMSYSKHFCNKLFIGIFHYENLNYHKALNLLNTYNTKTSKYYEALCYMKIKRYDRAVNSLNNIVSSKIDEDVRINEYFDSFYITNMEYVHELLGECYTQIGKRDDGLRFYMYAFEMNPLINSFNNLIVEGLNVKLKKSTDYFKDRVNYLKIKSENLIEKYKNEDVERGSYFLSECARIFFEEGKYNEAGILFEYIRRNDPHYYEHLDIYSTLLWHKKETDKLAFLCRTLIEYIPESYITWTALGNYFSLKYDHARALVCFKRSTYIHNHHYALSLLGHEYIIKQDYNTAMKYFVQSLKMYKNNYNALFALGIVYSHTGKSENAEYYFLKGIKLNNRNIKLKFMMMQFYNRHGNFDKAFSLFNSALNIQTTNLEEILNNLKQRNLNENEEMIVLEGIDYIKQKGAKKICEEILDLIKYRGKNYFYKKELVYEKNKF